MGEWDELAEVMQRQDFDHVWYLDEYGSVADAPGNIWAPSVFNCDTNDVDIDGRGVWECVTGMTGQYSYHGAVMHASEYIGGGMAEEVAHIADRGDGERVYFAVVAVEVYPDEEDEEPEPAGWTIAYTVVAVS